MHEAIEFFINQTAICVERNGVNSGAIDTLYNSLSSHGLNVSYTYGCSHYSYNMISCDKSYGAWGDDIKINSNNSQVLESMTYKLCSILDESYDPNMLVAIGILVAITFIMFLMSTISHLMCGDKTKRIINHSFPYNRVNCFFSSSGNNKKDNDDEELISIKCNETHL